MSKKSIIIVPRLDLWPTRFDWSCNPLDLRRYLVYWDEIAYPTINGSGPALDGDLRLLHLEGRLINQDVHTNGAGIDVNPINPVYPPLYLGSLEDRRDFVNKTVFAQTKLVDYNSRHLGGHWSLAQTGSRLVTPDGLEQARLVELSLYDGLPSPAASTPIEEVLEFV